MKELGRILEISGKWITIRGGELGGCFGCMSQECKVNGTVFTAENTLGLPLSLGQIVEIDNPGGAAAAQGLAVLAPPALAFAAGYLGTGFLKPDSGDELRAAVGVLGLLLGFLGVYWLRKLFAPGAAPRVIRVLEGGVEADLSSDAAEAYCQ